MYLKKVLRGLGLRGFTLIELLIVLLIIGTLATIAIPIFRNATIKAKLTNMLIDVGQYEKAIDLHVTENGWAALFDSNSYDIPKDNKYFRYRLAWVRPGPIPGEYEYTIRIEKATDAVGTTFCWRWIQNQADGVYKGWYIRGADPMFGDTELWAVTLGQMIVNLGDHWHAI